MPFLSPENLRKAMAMLSQMDDNALRFMGLTSMVIGLLLLNFIR